MRESTNTIPEQDEHARLLAVFAGAKVAAEAAARVGDDSDERDELYDREFARQLDAHGVTHEQARGVRVILRGCNAARRRETAADQRERELAAAREAAATRQRERSRAPDLFEQSAIDAVGTLTKWHIAFSTDTTGTLTAVEIQGWRQTSRFAGKPQGEFVVLRMSAAPAAGESVWHWPADVAHVTCTALAARSLKVRDAFIRHALQSTAFGAMSDDDRRHRAALCACADIADPALAQPAPPAFSTN